MNNSHLRTHSTRETAGAEWTSHVDVLNSVMDPIDVLSEADLQNELALYANAQFTFDTLPGVAVEDKPKTVSSFGIYRQPSSQSDTHSRQQHQQQHQNKEHNPHQHHHSLSLDISMVNNATLFNDTASSTVSSPYDQRQHYFSPLSSLPSSPTKLDKKDERQQLDPLLSFMMLSADQQRRSLQQDSPYHSVTHHLNTSQSTTITNLNNESQDAKDGTSTPKKKSVPTPRRRAQSTPGRQRQKEQQQQQHYADDEKEKHIQLGDQYDNSSGDGDTDYRDMDNDGDGGDDESIKLDKRRRNTAASARFRIKKKMREQSLQRTACEMTEKAKVLENRVHELEREVKWLKDLIVAKNRS